MVISPLKASLVMDQSKNRTRSSKRFRASSGNSSLHDHTSSTSSVVLGSTPRKLRLGPACLVRQSCGPSTPAPAWKEHGSALLDSTAPEQHRQTVKHSGALSARKLAADLWELHSVPFFRCRPKKGLDAESEFHSSFKAVIEGQCLSLASSPSRCIPLGLLPTQYKSEAGLSSTLAVPHRYDVLEMVNHVKSLEKQHVTSMSSVDSLNAQLGFIRHELKECRLKDKAHHKEVDTVTKKLVEARASWQEREQEVIRLAVHGFQKELDAERKLKVKLEMSNRRTIRELRKLKRKLEKASNELKKEKKARELMEDVCDELTRERVEDKAKVEEMKHESAKAREEVEEERKMLRMAEIWREERVQMKLMEAKTELQEKNAALEEARGELESLLKAKRAGSVKHEGVGETPKLPVLGQNLSASFSSKEARIMSRSLSHLYHKNELNKNACKQKFVEEGGSSGGEDDLHSIEIRDDSSGKPRMEQSECQFVQQQDAEIRRRSTDGKVSNADVRSWHLQANISNGLERTWSGQLNAKGRDFHWNPMQDSQWLEPRRGRLEMAEYSKYEQFSRGGDQSGDPKSSCGSFSTSPSFACPHYEEGEASLMVDMVHHQSYARPSPTCEWNQWSSSNVENPYQRRGKGSISEISEGWMDNSLKTKLMEAKLESQQARLRVGKSVLKQ